LVKIAARVLVAIARARNFIQQLGQSDSSNWNELNEITCSLYGESAASQD